MIVAIPAVLLFGGLTWILIRARTIRALEAIIVGGFGFFLASTGLGAALGAFLISLFHLHGAAVPPVAPAPPAVTTTVHGTGGEEGP